MKHVTIQTIHKQIYLIKIILNIILLIFYNKQYCYCLENKQENKQLDEIDNIIISKKTHKKKESNNIKIKIQSNHFKLNFFNQEALFLGDVIVTNNNCILYADKIIFYKKTYNNINTNAILSGTGNISYIDSTLKLTGEKITTNIQNKNADLHHNHFYFKKQQIYGTSCYIKQRENNRFTILKNAHLTTCPPNKNYWTITGSQILYDNKKNILDIWNTYLIIKKIPILYIYYLQLPLTNKNNIKYYPIVPQYSHNRIEIPFPYYFNINHNLHGKIITNVIPKQGIELKNSIQYSNKLNKGHIYFNNLLHCRKIKNNKNYWLLHWKNNNVIKKRWHINSYYTTINNYDYLNYTKLKYIQTADTYYTKKNISCQYTNNILNINCSYRECQPLNKYVQNIYNTKPQLNINFHTNNFRPWNYRLFTQITQFKSTNYKYYPTTTRLHIEPSIGIAYNILNINSNTEIKLQATHYQQNNILLYNKKNINNNIHLKHSVNRYLPQFNSNAQITLQKKRNIFNKYKQTLKPKIQYLYIPYYNQTNIALYDTTIFQIDQIDTIKHTLYSGLDRIPSTNQLTNSINTKIYDKNNTELLNISLAQIYLFKMQKTGDYIANTTNHQNNRYKITWVITNNWHINKSLRINTNLQYNTQIKKLKSTNTIIEHHTNNNTIIQINYRYFNSKYFSNIIPTPVPLIYQNNISQIGIIGNYPINTNLTISNTQFFNIQNQKTINQTIGIQYRTCCWKINAGYERSINTYQKTNLYKKYNNKLSINIILHGINSNLQSQSKICSILYTGSLPYHTIF